MIERSPGRGTIAVLAVACGVAVGNIYFPQAISPLVATDLGVSADAAAGIVTATQLGYAAGIVLLVPLGDRTPSRRLVLTLLGVTSALLLVAGAAPTLRVLVGASVLVGATTVVAPIIGSTTAGLVSADRRGTVSGTLLAGSIGGILLSRVVAGALGEQLGWRLPYLVAAVSSLLVAAVLARAMPVTVPSTPHRYAAMVAEPARLLFREVELRRSCLYQACVFAGFSAVWTCLPLLLTGHAYGLTVHAVGALGLVSAATLVCAPLAGRRADRRGPEAVNRVCLIGTVVSAGVLVAGGYGGIAGLTALTAGVLLLDVTMQSGMVANLKRVYGLSAHHRSRLNSAYMTCAFLGGSAGSWIGSRLYAGLGWPAVAGFVAATAAVALAHLHLKSPGELLVPAIDDVGQAPSPRRKCTMSTATESARPG